jgi:iron complex transport system permease protein
MLRSTSVESSLSLPRERTDPAPEVRRFAEAWRRLAHRRRRIVLVMLSAATILTAILCLHLGAQPLRFADTLALFFSAGALPTSDLQSMHATILWQVRLPRILLALLVGGCLSLVGASLQALLRNPLADPYVLGVSSGAALGASLAMSIGLGKTLLSWFTIPLWAFLGGLGAVVLVYRIVSTNGRIPVHTLLLAGVIVNAILSAVILFVTSVLEPAALYRVMSWLMGTLMPPDGRALLFLAGTALAGTVMLLREMQALNLLALGEESALSLGLNVERVKRRLFFATALLTGAMVSVSGMIGFVGMIVPHIVRLLLGSDHRLLLPASWLLGGCFLMLSDAVSRVLLAPSELPVGVITALIGGPIFVFLLSRPSNVFRG